MSNNEHEHEQRLDLHENQTFVYVSINATKHSFSMFSQINNIKCWRFVQQLNVFSKDNHLNSMNIHFVSTLHIKFLINNHQTDTKCKIQIYKCFYINSNLILYIKW